MKNVASLVTVLLLSLSACKSEKAPAAKPAEPTAKVVEPAVAPAPAPAPTSAPAPVAKANGAPDLKGLKVGSTAEEMGALIDKDNKWIAQRDCDSCSDGTYVYGDADLPRMTIVVKNGKVTKITDQPPGTFDVSDEPIGVLALGGSVKLVGQALGKPSSQTPVALRGETNRYETKWQFAKEGISLELASETEKGDLKIISIGMTAPSEQKTKRGIGIGSTRAEVEKAYADVVADEPVADPSSFYAGHAPGGLLEFAFTDNKVSEIHVSVIRGE